jgi:hypothetical protein
MGIFIVLDVKDNYFMYDQIIVTGCSHSTGSEFLDYKLDNFNNEKERKLAILKWYKNNFDIKTKNIHEIVDNSKKEWELLERKKSWPTLLEKLTEIPVYNLSEIGASIGKTLINFSTYLKSTSNQNVKRLAIHQLPALGRLCIRVNEEIGRINIVPNHDELGFAKMYFSNVIEKILNERESKLKKIGYIEKQFQKILNRIEWLSNKNNIDSFYILPEVQLTTELVKQKILINNFTSFREKFKKGKLGHPVDDNFNLEVVNICKKIL